MDVNCILPYDVLAGIFKYLPLCDRKNVRLTCHLWNDSSHHPTIVKREKFVFHPGVTRGGNMEHTGVCIANCRTLRSNFEFQSLPSGKPITRIPHIVWTECGDRITSLFFNECAVDEETVKNVLLYCPNLINLRISLLHWSHPGKDHFLNIGTVFDDLISLRITREKLISFELSTWKPMRDEDIKKLFQIHPKIRTFRHGYWSSDQNSIMDWISPMYSPEEDCGKYYHIRSKELLRLSSVENFTFNWWVDAELLKSFCLDLGVNKFKELELTMKFGKEVSLKRDILMDFFSTQTKLERLVLCLDVGLQAEFDDYDYINDLILTFLLGILKKLPKLKALTFHTHFDLSLEVPEFLEFLKLVNDFEFLDLTTFGMLDPSNLLSLLPSPSFKFINLKTLKLEHMNNSAIIQILRRTSCLSTLHLHTVDDQILQTIFKYHTKLKELAIDGLLECCTAAGLKGRVHQEDEDSSCSQPVRYSFASLQDLELLALTSVGFECFHMHISRKEIRNVYNAFLSELDFPRLKHFEMGVRVYNQLGHRLLRKMSEVAPYLETLEVPLSARDTVTPAMLLKYCSGMKRLKCVKYLVRFSSIDLYEQLFIEFPSLVNVFTCERRLYAEGLFFEDKIIFYDRITKTLTWSTPMLSE